MKRKHRSTKNIVAILFAIAFFITGTASELTVEAEEPMDISGYMKQTTDLSEFLPEVSNYSAETSIQESTVPVFLILITNGEESVVTSAFYMRDTNRTGNTYLVTSGIIGAFADGSYDMYVIRGDYSEQVTNIQLDESNVFAFLTVNGIEQFEPLEMTADIQGARSALAWLAMDSNQKFYMDFEELDLSGWKNDGGVYTSGGQLSDILLLGAPVIDLNTMNVWGMMYATGDFEPVIIDLNYVKIPETAAITTGKSTEQKPAASEGEETQTGQNPDAEEEGGQSEPAVSGGEGSSNQEPAQSTENDMTKWIGIAVIVAVAFVALKKKQTKKEIPANKPVAADEYKEGTIPLYPQENENKTQPIKGLDMVSYQIRGTGGIFKGQIFEVEGLLKIGRSQECQVQYPAKTGGISGIHCQIESEADGIIVRDLNSTYGTFYNGMKIQPQLDYHLKVGDVFYLGEETQSFRVEQAGEYRQEFTPTVKAVAEPEAGKIYHANAERKIVFGRSQNAQVRFAENAVPISTKHCVLYRDDSGLYLMDTGSTNGTFLSETLRLKPNVPYRMEKGSAFFLASPKYTFVITED